MVTCKPWCGIGVRHIQYMLMAIMNCMDFWIQTLTMSLFIDKSGNPNSRVVSAETESPRLLSPGTRVDLSDQDKVMIYTASFLMYSVGRILSTFVLIRISNKYLLLSCVLYENLTGGTLVWVVHKIGKFGLMIYLMTSSFTRSFHSPLMYSILGKWMPPCEYTTAFCLITIVKEMFSFLLSHMVAGMTYVEAYVVFMLLTFISLGWCALFLVFGAESPQTSFLISKQEWNYLSKTIGPRKKISCKAKVPWKSIFTCFLLYMYIPLDYGKETNATNINRAVSTIAVSMEVTREMMIAMQVALMIYSFGLLTSCVLIDRTIGKETYEAGPIRKIMTTVSCCGISITTILTSYVDDHVAKVSYLFMAQCFFLILHTVEPTILFDMTPNYAATVYSLLSFIRNLLIIGSRPIDKAFYQFDLDLKGPNSTSHIGPNSPDGRIFRYGFLIFFTNLFFIICGNIELKSFDSYDTYDWRKESIISYP